jgi:hypothetical protein
MATVDLAELLQVDDLMTMDGMVEAGAQAATADDHSEPAIRQVSDATGK